MQSRSISRLGRAALDLVYPPRCALCGSGGTFLCTACAEALPRAGGHRCDHCWLPLTGPTCFACAEHPGQIRRQRSALRYEGNVKRLVHAFKFGGQSSLAPALGSLLAATWSRYQLDADAIVPVALTGSRKRMRGYNQALLLANELSKSTGVPVRDALRRNGHSAPQAGSPSAEDRRKNVQGVFTVSGRTDVQGLRLQLIDDVATTCATLNACAAVLLDAGAASVSGLTLARED